MQRTKWVSSKKKRGLANQDRRRGEAPTVTCFSIPRGGVRVPARRRKEGGRDWARRAPQRDGRSGDTEEKRNSRLAAMAPAGMRNNSQRRAKVFQSRQAGADQTGARRERGLVESKDGLVIAGVGRSLGWLGRMQIWAWTLSAGPAANKSLTVSCRSAMAQRDWMMVHRQELHVSPRFCTSAGEWR